MYSGFQTLHDPQHVLILVLAMSSQLMDEVCLRDLSKTNDIGQFRRKTMLNLAFIMGSPMSKIIRVNKRIVFENFLYPSWLK